MQRSRDGNIWANTSKRSNYHRNLNEWKFFGDENSAKSALFCSSTYDINNDYARFGFSCGLLESIPIVGSVVFLLTNAIAAALFACDIERGGGPLCLRKVK